MESAAAGTAGAPPGAASAAAGRAAALASLHAAAAARPPATCAGHKRRLKPKSELRPCRKAGPLPLRSSEPSLGSGSSARPCEAVPDGLLDWPATEKGERGSLTGSMCGGPVGELVAECQESGGDPFAESNVDDRDS